ncbi:hypothetical protein M9Y10_029723 [Tritrichomonas musculus]|uniref:TLDc domain-containing protein n=1 Tax=Tritrichomonas musculus TaxID=1915356 RepID=A0ABR2KMX6_9EUKA
MFNRTYPIEDSVLFVIRAHTYNQINKTFKIEKTEDSGSQQLFILSKFCKKSYFEAKPKAFTMPTKNSILHFNLQMLKETSPVISKFIQDNPNENNYNININDDENALTKFEQLYQGKSIVLKEDELPIIQRFIQLLQIQNIPKYLSPKSFSINEIDSKGKAVRTNLWSLDRKLKPGIVLYQKSFINFINKNEFKIFKIITKHSEYNCSIFSVYTSNVIRQILEKDPTIDHYEYDFQYEEGEFQLICYFFNGKN